MVFGTCRQTGRRMRLQMCTHTDAQAGVSSCGWPTSAQRARRWDALSDAPARLRLGLMLRPALAGAARAAERGAVGAPADQPRGAGGAFGALSRAAVLLLQ
jgi:hypothetical protein